MGVVGVHGGRWCKEWVGVGVGAETIDTERANKVSQLGETSKLHSCSHHLGNKW